MNNQVHINDLPPHTSKALKDKLNTPYFIAHINYWLFLLDDYNITSPEIELERMALLLSSTKDE